MEYDEIRNLPEEEFEDIPEEYLYGEEDEPAEVGILDAVKLMSRGAWVKEARQIPLDTVEDPMEREVLIKCINQEPLTDDELDTLQVALGRYRKAIQEIQPEDTLENLEKNIVLIEDEHQFLQLIEDQKQNYILPFYYPLNDNTECKFILEVNPITDAQAILDIQENLSLYKDFTEKELNAYSNYQSGATQTREERIIAERTLKKINENAFQQQRPIAEEFLSRQTTIQGKDMSPEQMKQIYSNIALPYLLLLFKRVQDIAHLNDVETERVFRESD